MKKNIILLVLVASLLVAVPVAAMKHEPVGDRISLFFPPDPQITFEAGAPFHIQHGHGLLSADVPKGKFGFQLFVDGVLREADYISTTADNDVAPGFFVRAWVHNFPDGMTGEHIFIASWLAPCQWAVDNGYYSDSCEERNAAVEMWSTSLTVDFIP